MDGTFSEKALFEVMTAAEAAEKWGLNPRSIRKPVLGIRVGNLDFWTKRHGRLEEYGSLQKQAWNDYMDLSQLSSEIKRR